MRKTLFSLTTVIALFITSSITLAQSADVQQRIGALEEQIRTLNGQIEDLAFQLLEMQEAARKRNEDNEFRFQELEKPQKQGALKKPRKEKQTAALTTPQETPLNLNLDLSTDLNTASISGETGEEIYNQGYQQILTGQYKQAERSFDNYLILYPDGDRIIDSKYWYGESLFGQKRYKDAAKFFLNTHKAHPSAIKAPETLLKLGMSLAALESRETACATYAEVLTRYPNTKKVFKLKVHKEQARMSC